LFSSLVVPYCSLSLSLSPAVVYLVSIFDHDIRYYCIHSTTPLSTALRSSPAKSSAGRYACLAAAVVGFFFLMSLSSGNKDSGDSLRSGQAKRATIHAAKTDELPDAVVGGHAHNNKDAFSAGDMVDFDDNKNTEPSLDEDEVVEKAQTDFEKAILEQLASNQSMMSAAITSVMEKIRNNLEGLLGDNDDFDSEEIADLGNGLEDRLSYEITALLTSKCDALLEDKLINFEVAVDLDTEGEAEGDEDPIDLTDQEKKLIVELKDGVDDICSDVRGGIKHQGFVVESDVLMTILKEKTGKSYTLEVNDNEVITGFTIKETSTSTSTHTSTHKSKTKAKSTHHSSTSSHHHSSNKPAKSSHHKSSSHHHSSTKKKKPKPVSSVSMSSTESDDEEEEGRE
jgi:hypothetical protein